MPKQLLNYSKPTFKKSIKRVFDSENGQNDPLRGPIFDIKFDFRGHVSAFRAENTAKSSSFEAKNND